MQDAAWQRWMPLTGILFVILLVVGFVVMALPMPDVADAELTAFYEDRDNRVMVIVGAYIGAAGALALLLFTNRLRRAIVESEGPTATLASLVAASGAIFALALMIALAVCVAIPGAMQFADTPAPGADLMRYLPEIGGALVFVAAMPAAVAMIAATAMASFRYSIFPSWFSWLSVVCAIAVIFSALYIPAIAFLIWVVAGSVVLMQRQASPATSAGTAPAAA